LWLPGLCIPCPHWGFLYSLHIYSDSLSDPAAMWPCFKI
jgi:hypothetical protein